MTEVYSPNIIPTLVPILLTVTVLCIHVSVAINLFKYSKVYFVEEKHHLLFIHSHLWLLIGLLIGVVASVLVSFILAIQRR